MNIGDWGRILEHIYIQEKGRPYITRQQLEGLYFGEHRVLPPGDAAAEHEQARNEVTDLIWALEPTIGRERADALDCAVNHASNMVADRFISGVVTAMQEARGWSDGVWLIEDRGLEAQRARAVRHLKAELRLRGRLILVGYATAVLVGLVLGVVMGRVSSRMCT